MKVDGKDYDIDTYESKKKQKIDKLKSNTVTFTDTKEIIDMVNIEGKRCNGMTNIEVGFDGSPQNQYFIDVLENINC